MDARSIRPVEILLVEDDPGDARLTRKALETSEAFLNLNVVEDGVEAMAYLYHEGRYFSSPRPNLILLNLDLSGKGQTVLCRIKEDPDLSLIPVVVLTGTQAQEELYWSYFLHANSFITKPVDHDRLLRVIRSIDNFWDSAALISLEQTREHWQCRQDT